MSNTEFVLFSKKVVNCYNKPSLGFIGNSRVSISWLLTWRKCCVRFEVKCPFTWKYSMIYFCFLWISVLWRLITFSFSKAPLIQTPLIQTSLIEYKRWIIWRSFISMLYVQLTVMNCNVQLNKFLIRSLLRRCVDS